MKNTPELTRGDFARALRRSQRDRITRGELEPGDVAALRVIAAPDLRGGYTF